MSVKKGDKVKLHFNGKLKDGKVFATSEDKEPLEFEAGAGQILPGIDEEVIGMEKEEEKKITLSPEKGFGQRREELVRKVGKDMFKGKQIESGQRVYMRTQEGQTVPAQVMQIEEDTVTLDLNHPLAGRETEFMIKVVGIE